MTAAAHGRHAVVGEGVPAAIYVAEVCAFVRAAAVEGTSSACRRRPTIDAADHVGADAAQYAEGGEALERKGAHLRPRPEGPVSGVGRFARRLCRASIRSKSGVQVLRQARGGNTGKNTRLEGEQDGWLAANRWHRKRDRERQLLQQATQKHTNTMHGALGRFGTLTATPSRDSTRFDAGRVQCCLRQISSRRDGPSHGKLGRQPSALSTAISSSSVLHSGYDLAHRGGHAVVAS